jgi:hypothetical protein
MGLRDELQFLLKQVSEQRRRIKELEAKIDSFSRRFGLIRPQTMNDESDSRSGRASKASRKK